MKRRIEFVQTQGKQEQRTTISWFWILVPLVVFVLAMGLVVRTYGTYQEQRAQGKELEDEIRVLRANNKKLALLEGELLELRELQQQMLRLVGVERALGIDLNLLQELQAASEDSSGNELLLWPVRGKLLGGYTEEHTAVDLGATKGTTVVSPGDGRILKIVGEALEQSLYVDHDNGMVTIYRNMSMILVDPGDHVVAGQVLGLVGDGDHQAEPYLHFQVLLDGDHVRPEEFIFQEPPWKSP